MSAPSCGKCKSSMEEGFVLDRGHGNAKNVAQWIEGAPQRAWYGLKTKGHETHAIRTWRCTRCGYLESYAPETTESP